MTLNSIYSDFIGHVPAVRSSVKSILHEPANGYPKMKRILCSDWLPDEAR